jgi:hypothetical protein
MKILKTRPLLFLLLQVAIPGILAGQATSIDIHISPNIQSAKVDRISLDDFRLGQPTPVLDEAKAALGWHFASYSGEIEGYVPDAKIGKDMLPVDNTLLYSSPSTESTVLAVYKFGDNLEILDTGLWWKVRFEGDFPVYFVLDTPPPLPAVTATAASTPVAPATVPAPVIETAAVVTSSPVPIVTTLPSTTLDDEAPVPGVIGQSYHGTFKRSKKHLGLFKPKAAFYLEDASGDRIAWLAIEDIVVPGTINSYLDEQVVIHGERSRLKSDWIIHARNMRLK